MRINSVISTQSDPSQRLCDVNVPEIMRSRRESRISWFDRIMCGGLVPSVTCMFTALPGKGKSTIMLQLAEAYSKIDDVIVVYNSGEEHPYQIKMVAERLGLNGEFIIQQRQYVDELLSLADVLEEEYGKKVLILQDSLQTLLVDGNSRHGSAAIGLECVQKLIDWGKESFGNVIFINQVAKNGVFIGKNTVEHAIDCHMDLYIDEDKKSDTYGDLIFKLLKYRWGSSHVPCTLEMRNNGVFEKNPPESDIVHSIDNDVDFDDNDDDEIEAA